MIFLIITWTIAYNMLMMTTAKTRMCKLSCICYRYWWTISDIFDFLCLNYSNIRRLTVREGFWGFGVLGAFIKLNFLHYHYKLVLKLIWYNRKIQYGWLILNHGFLLMRSASQSLIWNVKGRSYALDFNPCSITFSYLCINLIIIIFISTKARFFPMQLRGPPLKPSEINCFFSLYSYFYHLSGINSWGSSNIYWS